MFLQELNKIYFQLYSVIFKLPFHKTISMFIYLCWKKEDGKTLKTLLPVTKATRMSEQLENKGITTWFKSEHS